MINSVCQQLGDHTVERTERTTEAASTAERDGSVESYWPRKQPSPALTVLSGGVPCVQTNVTAETRGEREDEGP